MFMHQTFAPSNGRFREGYLFPPELPLIGELTCTKSLYNRKEGLSPSIISLGILGISDGIDCTHNTQLGVDTQQNWIEN